VRKKTYGKEMKRTKERKKEEKYLYYIIAVFYSSLFPVCGSRESGEFHGVH
jgi:hypothetical protein